MRAVAIVLAVISFAALGGAAASAAASGLRGVVMRGPTTPVCREPDPCEEPAVGIALEFRRAGHLVAQVRTGRGGGYRVRLRSGTYAVTTPGRAALTRLTPRVVRVPTGRFDRVDFHLDTGIQ